MNAKKLLLISLLLPLFSTTSFANIDDSVVYHEGFPFPAVKNPSSTSGRLADTESGWYCDPFERTTYTNQASIDLFMPALTRKKKKKESTTAYTPPVYYMIESAERVKHETKGDWNGSDTLLQPNQLTLTESQYEEIYEEVHNYLLSFNLPSDITGEIDAQLYDFINSYTYLSNVMRTTHGTVQHWGRVQGRGVLAGKSVYRASITVHLICSPPETYSTTAAESTLRNWVNARVAEYQGNSEWTPWLDRDTPSGNGDFENLQYFTDEACASPDQIQARIVGQTRIYEPGDSTPDVLAAFSATQGLVCQNSQQNSGKCNNYEVRFLCP